MTDVLIRGIDPKTLERLKDRAKRNGRSLQGEAKHILSEAAATGSEDVAGIFSKWHKRFVGRKFSGSAALIREDRTR